jgi:hypothetical protein
MELLVTMQSTNVTCIAYCTAILTHSGGASFTTISIGPGFLTKKSRDLVLDSMPEPFPVSGSIVVFLRPVRLYAYTSSEPKISLPLSSGHVYHLPWWYIVTNGVHVHLSNNYKVKTHCWCAFSSLPYPRMVKESISSWPRAPSGAWQPAPFYRGYQ